jgi:hypothetical protein
MHYSFLTKLLLSYQRKEFYRQAVLNVSLWNKLYKRFQKNLPENIEAALHKIITGAELSEIKKMEKDIRRGCGKGGCGGIFISEGSGVGGGSGNFLGVQCGGSISTGFEHGGSSC